MEQETTASYAAESSTSDIWKQLPIAFSCIMYAALLPRTAVTRDRGKNVVVWGRGVISLNFEQLQSMFLTPFTRNCKWDTCLGKQNLHGCTPCRDKITLRLTHCIALAWWHMVIASVYLSLYLLGGIKRISDLYKAIQQIIHKAKSAEVLKANYQSGGKIVTLRTLSFF